MKTRRAPIAFALIALCGCSSLGGSAIRTGPVQLPAYAGPVAIYPTGVPPAGAVDLGVVEVHAVQQEATVDALLPLFVKKVAQIGGNVAVIDGMRARFEVVGRTQMQTYYYTCGAGVMCAGQRVYSADDEVMIVSIFGHAMTTRVSAPESAPLIPPGPPPPPLPETPAPEPAPSQEQPVEEGTP